MVTAIQYSVLILIFLFANAALSQDFVIVEPQTRTYNMNENITLRVYHDLEDVEELIDMLNCTEYELGKGYLSIEMTSVIHNLNGLAELGYKVVGYGRDTYFYDRWTLQRRIAEDDDDDGGGNSVISLKCFSKMSSMLIVLMLLLSKEMM